MPRKWGAKAARKAVKKIAKSNKVPQSFVKPNRIRGRLSTRLRVVGSAEPGTKVKARTHESLDGMMRRLKYGDKSKSQTRKYKKHPKGVKGAR